MAKTLGDVMSANPVTLQTSATAADAAREMRDKSIGNVLVTEQDSLFGIVTDRDLVTRCISEGADPDSVTLRDVCSTPITALSQTDDLHTGVKAMREQAVRRVAIIDEDGAPIGIVSLGDLALSLDRESALGEISSVAPNN